jgi:ATP-dependent helicase Lhr and Lhr-like helicase
MSFDLLSLPMRKWIRDKRWEALRRIQAAAIEKIMTTDLNYILASATASGKTEAAFLPILSIVKFSDPGVQVLYISPLIALINDQLNRVEEMCMSFDIPVTKWHGEANRSGKDRLLKQPEGIVLITPESIEAMFMNKPAHVKHLFSNLKFIIIDEIHAFTGTDRGIQLQSLLYRLRLISVTPVRYIGLSATIGDYTIAKKIFGDPERTRVLLDKSGKDIEIFIQYMKEETNELSQALMTDMYEKTKDHKVLIFPNSRGKAEEIAVKLLRLADKNNGHANYFSHHSSVHKDVREYVEKFAKENIRLPFCISCTSTLELGIDIGTVDKVVQVNSTHSIASLIQRVGRSGRKEGQKSELLLYATDEWNLLQSVACWSLYNEEFIEPPAVRQKPFDILLHQVLAIIKSSGGIPTEDILSQFAANAAFLYISKDEVESVIDHLLRLDFLEKIRGELIIGVTGEKVVNSYDFYSVFKTDELLKVINAGNTIGEIPFSPQIREEENILLAAKIWKIKFVDVVHKRIEVTRAADGKKPIFGGSAPDIHPTIRHKMMEMLYSTADFSEVDKAGTQVLQEMRNFFSHFPVKDILSDKPVLIKENKCTLFSFTGSRINRTIEFLIKQQKIDTQLHEQDSTLLIPLNYADFDRVWTSRHTIIEDIDKHLMELLEGQPGALQFSKWGHLLPVHFQMELLKEKYFDIESIETMKGWRFVINE